MTVTDCRARLHSPSASRWPFHCLWALGFEPDVTELRRFAHSLLGCFFYGVFAMKVLLVRAQNAPTWTSPVIGGTVFTTLVAIWMTSSL